MTREEKVYKLASRLLTGAALLDFIASLDDETIDEHLGIFHCKSCNKEVDENDLGIEDECPECELEREAREIEEE